MRSRKWIGIAALGLILVGGFNVYTTLGESQVETVPQPTEQIAQVEVDPEYVRAKNAIDMIYESISLIEADKEQGKILISANNPSDYTFSSLMIDIEFLNSKGEAYYYETVFLTDGLKPGEFKVLMCDVVDKEMMVYATDFNFFIQGF